MEVAIFLGCILGVLLILGSMPAINEHCEMEYDYKPFSVGNFFAVFIVYAFLFGTLSFINETTNELTANSIVLLVLAVLIFISMFVNSE